MNGAGQEIGPVAFEERLVVTVQTSDGARLADEGPSVEPDMNLLRPVLGSLGHEADVFKHANAGFGHAIARPKRRSLSLRGCRRRARCRMQAP